MSKTAYLDAAFKQTANGWIYAPAIAFMGPHLGTRFGTQYLVSDTQKSAIQATIGGWQRAMARMCLVYAILCGLAAILAMGLLVGLWTSAALPRITLPDMNPALAGFLFALPLFVVLAIFPFAAWRARAGATPSSERISYEDAASKAAAAWSVSQIKMQLGANLLFVGLALGFVGKSIESGRFVSALLWAGMIVLFGGIAINNIKVLKAKRSINAQEPSNC